MPPVFRTAPDIDVLWSQETSRMTEGTLCGALIYASDESRPMTATLGGVLDIQGFDGKWHRYGMTAGHLLNQRTVRAQIQAPSLPLDDSEDGQSEPEDYPCTDVNEYDLEIVWQAQEAVDTPTKQTDSLSALGTAFVDTELASFRDLDFALIEFDSDDTAKPNVLVNWQLDDQEEPAKELRMNDIHPLAGVFTRRSVLVLWNGDNIKGTLSRDATSLLAGLSWSFVETFTLVLDEGRAFPVGISGAWVVDGESGIVYGHVAAVDAFDEAYVVPLASVVDRILLGLPAKAVRLDWPAEPDPHATADDPRNVASEPPPAATHSLAPYRRGNIVSLQVDAKADSVGSSGQDSGYGSWASSARSSSNEMDHAHPPLTVVPTSGLPFGRPAEGNFTSSTSQPNLTSLRRVAGVDQRPVDLLYGRDRDQALLHTEMTNTKSRIDRVTAAKASELSPEESSDGAGEAELASLNRVMSRIRASKYFAECYKQGQNDDEAGSASKVELEPKRKSQSHQSEERMRPAYGEHITEAAESAEGFDAMEHDDEILRRKPAERSNPATAGNTQAEGQTTYFSRSKWTSASNTKSATPQQSTTEKDALDRAQRPARRSRLTDSM